MTTFRTTDNTRWGAGKGADLTAVEVDMNFWDAIERISALEAEPPEAVGIDTITSTDNTFTVHLTDGSTQGPFNLPTAQFTVIPWTPNTLLSSNTFVTEGSSTYLVNLTHTSASSFDPNATDGFGHDLYGLLPFPSQPILHFLDAGWTPNTTLHYGEMFSVPDVGVFLVLRDHVSAATFDPAAENGSGQPLYQKIFTPIESEIANIQFQFAGHSPSDGSTVLVYIQDDDRDLVFDTDFVGSFAHLEVSCTSVQTWTLRYLGETVGTIVFTPGDLLDGGTGQFGVITGTGASIPNGDILRMSAPSAVDATANFMTLSLRGRFVQPVS
jgi:hypothetical protein